MKATRDREQVPRNLFRGQPQADATDAQARAIARRTLERGTALKTIVEV